MAKNFLMVASMERSCRRTTLVGKYRISSENNNKTISELEWIQYQLDNYEKVDEVIENINSLTIKPIARIHYFFGR